jgi:16S rRNA (cytidine1402-2'-O)-methyltransferase
VQLLRHLRTPQKQLLSHHEHNWADAVPHIIDLASKGNSLAVVSDAGTPCICDPGAQLASACIAAGIPLHPVPGASAVTAALSVSGFAASEFTFIGFLPFRGTDKTNKLAHIASIDHIVVFFEAPHRVVDTFEALMLLPHMSTRQCMFAREITKVYEEFQRGTIQQCKIQYFYSVVCIYITYNLLRL